MNDLIAYISARLDEDEAAARAVKPLGHVFDMGGTRLGEEFSHGRVRFASEDGRSRIEGDAAAASHFARHDPARVLREVEAKRAIVASLQSDRTHDAYTDLTQGGRIALSYAVRKLASAWSDHPDYDPAWA